MNKYPLWKNLLILFAVVLGFLYALPNIYPPDPAIQISHDSGVVDERMLAVATAALDEAGIEHIGATIENSTGLIRLASADQQRRAQQLIDLALPDPYIVALNLAPTTPGWLSAIGAGPMTYGLDLSGGVHFLLEVDLEAAINKRLNDSLATIRNLLRDERIRYLPPVQVDSQNRIVLRFNDPDLRGAASTLLRREFPTYLFRTAEAGNNYMLYLSMSEASILELQGYALQQNLTTLRTRVDELGVKEPRVQPMGANRIIVQLPGIQDTARAKDLISAIATLSFHLGADISAAPGTTEEYDYQGYPVRIETDVIVAGENVTNAQSSFDENGLPQVNITLDAEGARRMNEVTRRNVGRQMAILLIETKTRSSTTVGPDGELITVSEPYEERRMISWATIQSALGRQFRITGLAPQEANDLALLIRSGALAAPMYFMEERTVGPSLGQANIDAGVLSVQLALLLVGLSMVLLYRVCGMAANIALVCNLTLLVALMSIIGATLTMPGIAGIVLTIGMAVDGNVLIFSRIREELRAGASVQQAIDVGFGRAFTTILDANVTTLLMAVILYAIGTGPVRGFAVTLSIGIVTSMFTAILVTRAIVNLIYGGRGKTHISIGLKLPERQPKPAASQ